MRLFKKLRYNKRMEDKNKVEEILKELNNGQVVGMWVPADGFHTYTVARFEKEGAVFDPSSGIIVKVFIHQETKEIKTYYHTRVTPDAR